MIDYFITLDEARKHKYGNMGAMASYKEGRCAFEVWDNFHAYQCKRPKGYGVEGLYCKQHAKKVEGGDADA
jgi:hypothetical protein